MLYVRSHYMANEFGKTLSDVNPACVTWLFRRIRSTAIPLGTSVRLGKPVFLWSWRIRTSNTGMNASAHAVWTKYSQVPDWRNVSENDSCFPFKAFHACMLVFLLSAAYTFDMMNAQLFQWFLPPWIAQWIWLYVIKCVLEWFFQPVKK